MTTINEHLQELASQPLHALTDFRPSIRTLAQAIIATRLTNQATQPPALSKALNELATLINQAVATLAACDNSLKADVTYLQQKQAEHETQLNDLFGAAPNKLTRRVDALDDKITAAIAGTNAAEQLTENLQATVDAYTDYHYHGLRDRLENLEHKTNILTDANIEASQRLANHNADTTLHPTAHYDPGLTERLDALQTELTNLSGNHSALYNRVSAIEKATVDYCTDYLSHRIRDRLNDFQKGLNNHEQQLELLTDALEAHNQCPDAHKP